MSASSLNTEDYNYLINNKDIITTCQEALLENDLSVPSVILSDLSLCKETNGEGDETKDGGKDSSQVSCKTNKASESGLGSPSKSDKKRVPGSSLGEFSEWLNHVERQLDTVCFCMILAWESKDKTNGVEKKVPSKDHLKENQVNFHVSGNHSISAISSSSLVTDAVISPGILTSTPIKSDEGRNEMTSNDETGDKIKMDDSCKRSAKLCQQQDQQQLSSTKDQTSSNKNSGRRLWRLALHKQKALQTEVESVGRKFISFIRQELNNCKGHPSIIRSARQQLKRHEERWHTLWIRSLEFLMIIEECNKCPNHFARNDRLTSGDFLGRRNIRGGVKENTINSREESGYATCPAVETKKQEKLNRDNDKEMPLFDKENEEISFTSSPTNICNNDSLNASPVGRSNSQRRKRHMRRRGQRLTHKLSPSSSMGSLNLSSTGKQRPWSFHAANEWNDWDYYQPPSFIHPSPYKSSEELSTCSPFDDTIRSLTEFGENYEYWFKTDDGCGALRASTPVRSTESGLNREHKSPLLKDASACTEETGVDSRKHLRKTLLYPCPAEDTDESGKRSSSSGCFFSDEDDEFDDHHLLLRRRQEDSKTWRSEDAIKSVQEREVQTDKHQPDVNEEDKMTMTVKGTGIQTSSGVTQSLEVPVTGDKNSNRSKYYMLFVTFTLVSLFLSLVLSSKRPFHLELEYKRPPPV